MGIHTGKPANHCNSSSHSIAIRTGWLGRSNHLLFPSLQWLRGDLVDTWLILSAMVTLISMLCPSEENFLNVLLSVLGASRTLPSRLSQCDLSVVIIQLVASKAGNAETRNLWYFIGPKKCTPRFFENMIVKSA